MAFRKLTDGLEDLPKGYVFEAYVGTDQPLDEDDLDLGYCAYPGLNLDDMFGAFVDENYGVVGGAVTVDDFTPEGLEDRIGGKQLPGTPMAEGGIGGSTRDAQRGRSSAPEFGRGIRNKVFRSGSGDKPMVE